VKNIATPDKKKEKRKKKNGGKGKREKGIILNFECLMLNGKKNELYG
jgi:hypothetical protein